VAAHTAFSAHQTVQKRERPKIGDIFRRFGPAYRSQFDVTALQVKVMRAIEACRTPVLGGHRRHCDDCGHDVDEFNSCRNRHCPTCQAMAQAKWIAGRLERVLPIRHFHAVFTLPAQLRPIAHANRKLVFALLFRTAADTLLELGRDKKRLDAQLGLTAVLHTWTRKLEFHPHVHCVVTAGGFARNGSPRWIHVVGDFLFPVRVVSKLFRGKFMAGLDELYQAKQLKIPVRSDGATSDVVFSELKDKLYQLDWVVYCKEPFAGSEHVFSYLGRYTHRVAISNARLISFDDNGVRFTTKDGQDMTLKPFEFIRRFLMHTLPCRFVKIRHYGLMASGNVNGRLEVARSILTPKNSDGQAVDAGPPDLADLPWEELFKLLTGVDLGKCPACGSDNYRRHRLHASRPEVLDTS